MPAVLTGMFMRRGHSGIVCAFGQSTLIPPFFDGLISWHGPATSTRVLGVAATCGVTAVTSFLLLLLVLDRLAVGKRAFCGRFMRSGCGEIRTLCGEVTRASCLGGWEVLPLPARGPAGA